GFLAVLLVAAATLAYGAHVWIVRWDVAARNVVLPSLGAAYLLFYFWGLGVVLERLPALRGEPATPLRPEDPALLPPEDSQLPRAGHSLLEALSILALGIGAGTIVILGLGSIGLLRLSVFAPLSALFVVLGSWRRPPWRWRQSRHPLPRGIDA